MISVKDNKIKRSGRVVAHFSKRMFIDLIDINKSTAFTNRLNVGFLPKIRKTKTNRKTGSNKMDYQKSFISPLFFNSTNSTSTDWQHSLFNQSHYLEYTIVQQGSNINSPNEVQMIEQRIRYQELSNYIRQSLMQFFNINRFS